MTPTRPTGDDQLASDLLRGVMVFKSSSDRRELSKTDFWQLVAAYADWVEITPAVGGFGIIAARTGPRMLALFVAMIVTGRSVAFFPPASPRQDREHYFHQQREALARIRPTCLLVDDETTLSGDGLCAPLIVIPDLDPQAGQDKPEASVRFAMALSEAERILFWQHSSGTTGIKKAVGVTAAMLLAQRDSYWPLLQGALDGAQVRIASWLPLYHDMGLLASFLLPLLSGADMAYVDPFDWIDEPQLLFETIQSEGSNLTWMPNFAFRHFVRLKPALGQHDLSSMRLWISCSEPCRHADAADFEAAFSQFGVKPGSVVGCYAMAETVFAVTQSLPGPPRALNAPRDMKPGERLSDRGAFELSDVSRPPGPDMQQVLSSGRLIDGMEAGILADGRIRTEDGLYGEIVVRGRSLFNGYRDLDAVRSSIGPDGYFRTGDLGCLVDVRLYVFGRTKELIIVNGKNIYAGDVEACVNAVDGVRPGRSVAFGIDSARTGSEVLIVVAEAEPAAAGSEAELRSAILAAVNETFLVTPYDVRITAARWLVKSSSGKISREANKLKYVRDFGF